MKIFLNENNVNISDLKSGAVQLPTALYTQRFHQVTYYALTIRPNNTNKIEDPFETAGTFTSLALILKYVRSHYENGTVSEITIKLQENVSGTWIDRSVASTRSDEWLQDGYNYNFIGMVKFDFDTPVAVDTTAGKWRFRFENQRVAGTDAAYTYFGRLFTSGSFSDTIFYIPFSTTLDTYDPTADHIMANFGKITLDESTDFEGVPTTGYGFYGAGYQAGRAAILSGTTKASEPHPQMHIPSTTNDIEIKLGGYIYIAPSYSKRKATLLVGDEDASGNITRVPFNKKVKILGHNHSSTWRGMFVTDTSSGYGAHRRFSFYGEQGSYKAVMSEAHHKGDTEIKLTGDFSDWQIGEKINTTFPMERANRSYRDYEKIEVKTITSVSYDAGTNVTTIGIDSALSWYYDYQNYTDTWGITIDPNIFPYYVVNIDRVANIFIEEEDGGYCQSASSSKQMDMYSYLWGLLVKMEGVRIANMYRFSLFGHGSTKMIPADRNTAFAKNVWFKDSYYGLYLRYQNNIVIDGGGGLKGGVANTAYAYLASYMKGMTIKNTFTTRASYFLSASIPNIWLENNEFEGNIFVQVNGSGSVRGKDNIHRKGVKSFYYYGGSNISLENTNYGIILYISTYNNDSNYDSAIHSIRDNTLNIGQGNFINDTVVFAHNYVRANAGSGADIYFKDTTYQKLIATVDPKVLTSEAIPVLVKNTDATMKLVYENFQNDGIKEGYFNWGKMILTNDGTDITLWDGEKNSRVVHTSLVADATKSFTMKARIKIDSADYWAGYHSMPKLKFEGLGMDGAEVEARQTTDWQYLTLTAQPNTTGIVKVVLETESEAVNNKVIFDTLFPFTDEPRSSAERKVTYRGLPSQEIFSEKLSPLGVWQASTNLNYGAGSFGEAVGEINENTELIPPLLSKK